jgi:hypothetical protein
MRCSYAITVFLGATALVAGAQDEKPSKARAVFEQLRKEFEKADDRYAVLGQFTKKLQEHAKKYPKDASAAEALVWIVQLNPKDTSKDGPRAQALALLREGHLKSPTITCRLVGKMALSGGDLERLARDVAASHPDKRTRAFAYRALIHAGQYLIRRAEPLKDADPEEFAKRFGGERLYDKYGGPEGVKKLLEEARLAALAIPKYRAKLKGELKGVLPDVSVGAKAPPTEAVDLKGKRVRLSDLKGKVVVLRFLTT